MSTAYLHLGSNEEEPLKQLLKALRGIEEHIGHITAYSPFYKTEAWGNKDQNDFINMAISVSTDHKASTILEKTQSIESSMGRVSKEKWSSRIIDIDIIFLDNEVINTSTFTLPHPHMETRNFVLIPMMDIAGDFIHPVLDKTVEDLYLSSPDTCEVILL